MPRAARVTAFCIVFALGALGAVCAAAAQTVQSRPGAITTAQKAPAPPGKRTEQKTPQAPRAPQQSIVQRIAGLIPRIFAEGGAPYVIVDFGDEPEKQSLLAVKGLTEVGESSLRLFAGSVRQPPFSPVTVKGSAYSEEISDSKFRFVFRDGAWLFDANQHSPTSIPPRFWVVGTVGAGATVYDYMDIDTPNIVAGADGATVGVDVLGAAGPPGP